MTDLYNFLFENITLGNVVLDGLTILILAVTLLIALLSCFLNPFFRVGVRAEEETPAPARPVSIVLTPINDAIVLEKNLKHYLEQDYPEPYEVIVVAPQEDKETADILKRYASNPKLYTTFVPQSSRYMSRKKLAITLGVKAAKHEWVAMVDIACHPQSSAWLASLVAHCHDGKNLVVSHTKYDYDTPDFRRFERIYTDLYVQREYRSGRPYRCIDGALLFRKNEFIDEEGFRGDLKYLRGEFDFMVNKYAKRHSLAIDTSDDGTLIEETPTDKEWRNRHLFYMENRKHLERSLRHRIRFNFHQIAMRLGYLSVSAALAFAILTERWILATGVGIIMLFIFIIRTTIARKAIERADESIPAGKIVPYELRILWHNIACMVRYRRADKNDFISHKI